MTKAFEGRGYITVSDKGYVTSLFTFVVRILPSRVLTSTQSPRGHHLRGLCDEAFRMSLPPSLFPSPPEVMNVVIVGGGQAGLSLSARFKKMDVTDVVILEKVSERIGHSLVLKRPT